SQPPCALSKIIGGQYDSYLTQWAQAAKAWGHPFFIRLFHEFNGNWVPWNETVNGNQPGQFVATWRHIHDIFTAVGATNVSWVWSPNIEAPTQTDLPGLYPGDTYVDWLGIDGYNFGTCSHGGTSYPSFDQVFRSTYNKLASIAPAKPIMIAEVAAEECGGDKGAWINDMLTVQLPNNYPRVSAVVWWNWNND